MIKRPNGHTYSASSMSYERWMNVIEHDRIVNGGEKLILHHYDNIHIVLFEDLKIVNI
jgi:hypothetical protein